MSKLQRPCARLVYWRFSGFNGENQFIGGVETYIRLLAECCSEMDMPMILYQCAEKPFQRTIGEITVNGIQTPTTNITMANRKALSKAVVGDLNFGKDILLYVSDEWSVKTSYSKAILIQHGIGWDKPIQFLTNKAICRNNKYMERIKRWKERQKWLHSFENCRNRVCVDYNFLNWYRTYRTLDSSSRVWVIPNASPVFNSNEVATKLASDSDNVRILFARRFEPFRGTRLMADVAARLLHKFPNVLFTFAGDGADKEWLIEGFKHESRVTVCKIDYEQRMNAYFEHDVVVIPSFGSEGTSLSAIEAMCSGCATVATDSGGITNLIIDGFNGLLVRPEADEFERSLTLLIENREFRKGIASAAHKVAQASLSVPAWKTKWCDLLKQVSELE
jgi:glycosyltransferase involved in cell wall biosynthesis